MSCRLDAFAFQLSVTSFQANGQPATQSHARTPRHTAPPCCVLQWSKTSIETPTSVSPTPQRHPHTPRPRTLQGGVCHTVYDGCLRAWGFGTCSPARMGSCACPAPPTTHITHSLWHVGLNALFCRHARFSCVLPPTTPAPLPAHARLTHSPLPAAGSPAQVVAHALRMAGTKREIVCMTVASLPAHAR